MLTVMMATFNGERTLPDVLEAYRHLKTPDRGWRIVIIDNGSTDSTSEILDKYEKMLPMIRLFVPDPGKNNALNAGLTKREGDLIVFTDDDAIPASDWLHQLRKAADINSEFDIFGGAIRPRWERQPEKLILDYVPQGIAYAITDQTLKDGPIPATVAWGPNMAVRSRLFDEGNFFSGNIGPMHNSSYAMGSETDFTRRMEKLGYRTWFVSSAIVEHMIREYQLERSWIMGRAIRYGRGLIYREKLNAVKQTKQVLGIPRYQVRRLLVRLLRLMTARLKGDTESAFKESWDLHCTWGYVHECWRESRK